MKNHSKPSEPCVGSVIALEVLDNEKFVIGNILKGGMGIVYQLVPVRMAGSGVAALKTYQKSANRSQFIRESRLWISLGTHPYIAHAICYTEWLSKPAIIASWYDNALAETDIAKWPSSEIMRFASQLIGGLEYALDRAHIIHQDIKPANVLLDNSNSPHVSDFGMARFAAVEPPGIRSIDDVRLPMCHSVSFGPFGGTPLYMAPELFAGASPSVRTDIYSLGVTLYQAVTGQHPFIGPETGYRFRPVLRDAPLYVLLNERGAEIRPFLDLVTGALSINPQSRPNSYGALLSVAGLGKIVSCSASEDEVNDAVAQAAFLRKEGRYEAAATLLQEMLKERPTNPVLLNSYAVLELSIGRMPEAWNTWEMAVASLRFTNGEHDNGLYIDPVANLAGQMICRNQFREADELLSTAWGWLKESPHIEIAPLDFTEFAWWHLYNGKFEEACRHILAMYRFRAPDEASLLWITLAAWLSGNFSEYATQLAEFYLSLENLKLPTALSACAVAASCADALAAKLINVGTRGHEAEISEIARDLGLKFQTFKRPLDHWVCKTIIRSADMRFTGGKYSGIIG
jgi:serine/threonine protein kinase